MLKIFFTPLLTAIILCFAFAAFSETVPDTTKKQTIKKTLQKSMPPLK
jgi:hypothetical protein